MARSWRLAKSLQRLESEIKDRHPGTTVWDIGDADHRNSSSDHNPNDRGVVCAIDVLGDGGLDLGDFAEHLKRSGHKAVKYVIFNRRIWSKARDGEGWRDYHGSNPHTTHVHVSVGVGPDGESTGPYDSTAAWGIADIGSSPKPSTPAEVAQPAPGPHYDFPLGPGMYFGPKGGPDASVSGYYGRRFKGKTDREWLKIFGAQLDKRGWDAHKGGRYLTKYGNDGFYGPEYRELTRAFQADQGLKVDGLPGPRTWRAAFENPVT